MAHDGEDYLQQMPNAVASGRPEDDFQKPSGEWLMKLVKYGVKYVHRTKRYLTSRYMRVGRTGLCPSMGLCTSAFTTAENISMIMESADPSCAPGKFAHKLFPLRVSELC